MTQPEWQLDHATDTWALYIDTTGEHEPEAEVWDQTGGDREDDPDGLVYRFIVERLEEVPVTLGGGVSTGMPFHFVPGTGEIPNGQPIPEYEFIHLVHVGWGARDPDKHEKLETKVDEIGMTVVTRCSCGKTFDDWHASNAHYRDDVLPHDLAVYNEWFNSHPDRWNPQGGLASIASSAGRTVEDLRAALCGEDVRARLHAYLDIGGYHGYQNLDSYPLECTLLQWEWRCGDRSKPRPQSHAEAKEAREASLANANLACVPCGQNADWSVEAWCVTPGADPNRSDGAVYLLEDEDAERGHPRYRVVATYPSKREAEDFQDGEDLVWITPEDGEAVTIAQAVLLAFAAVDERTVKPVAPSGDKEP